MARVEKEVDKMIVEEDLQDLIADADAVFSQYIRLKYADKEGKVKCFTCDEKKHWTLLQNGHFVSRSHLYLRWDERNCRPQCRDCNEFKHGNIPEYAYRLEMEQHGINEILQEEMRLVHKPTRDEIKQIVAHYAPIVKQLKKNIQ